MRTKPPRRSAGESPSLAYRTIRTAAISLGCLAAMGWANRPSLAALPPYAEEWSTVGQPQDVEVDASGRVWVSCDDDSIRVYAATGGELLFAFGGTGSGDGEFQTPYGIAFDQVGDVYICDYSGARLEKFTSEGVFLSSWPIPSTHADHVDVDDADDVYVSGYTDFSVHKYTPAGVHLLDWASDGVSQTSGVLAVGGIVHVVQWDAPVVEQFATDGTFLGSWAASTNGGTDIEIDSSDQIWVADFNNNVIRVFDTSGVPIDVLGSPGAGPGEFDGAIGVGIGTEGSIYVADQFNYRIQRFGASVADASSGLIARDALPALRSIAPNPSRGTVEITYAVPSADDLRITITDVSGRTVATLRDAPATAGVHRLVWEARQTGGSRLPSAVYFARLASAGGVSVARLVVVE